MATNNKNFRVKNGLDVNGEINVSAVGGDEGGQINLEKPATGTTLSGNVSIDIYQNRIRIFDAAGTNKGAYIDLSAATDGVGSNLLAGGGAGITSIVEDTTPQLGGDLDAQGYDITNLNSLTFDTTPTSPGTAAGTIYWDDGDGIAKAILNANVTIGLGQESVITVKNATGSTITKGTVLYINGAQGQMPTVALADADTEATSSKTFGFAAEAIADGAEGFVVTEGVLRGVNTASFTEGGAIWLSSTAGQYTQTIPDEPAHAVFLGYAVKAHASAGEVIVKIQNGYELTELHGVTIANTAATNDILQLNSSGIWVNANLATAGIANLSGATFTGNIAGTNLSLSGKDIFSNTGTGAPTFTTYSSGVRTVFYDNVGGTSVGYSRGIDAGVLWDSIPAADAGMYFKWYGGETQVASLSGTGVFTATTVNATTFNGNLNATTVTTSGDIAVNGGDITTTSTTATLYNTTATTVNIARAATALDLGASTGVTTIHNDLQVAGNITFTGNATTLSANDLSVSDPIIYIGANNTGHTFDLGIVGHFNDGTYQHTGLARDADDNTWKLFSNVVSEPTTTVDFTNAEYDALKVGNVTSVSQSSNATIALTPHLAFGAVNVAAITIGDKSNVASFAGIMFNTGTDGTNLYDSGIFANGGNTADGYGTLTVYATGLIINNASSNAALQVSGTIFANNFSGSGANLTSIPNSGLANSAITINGTSVSLGGSTTIATESISPFLLMGG